MHHPKDQAKMGKMIILHLFANYLDKNETHANYHRIMLEMCASNYTYASISFKLM